jgi:streptogramin lyase
MALDLEEQEQVAELKAWWQQYGSLVVAAITAAAVAIAALAVVLVLALGGGGDKNAAGKVLSPVAIGAPAVDAFATGTSVWVAAQGDGTLRRIDAENGKPVGDPVRVFDAPYRLAGAGTSLWTISSSVSKAAGIDDSARAPKARTVDLPSSPYDVAVGEDAVWIVGNAPGARQGGQLIAVDPSTGRLRQSPSKSGLDALTTGHGAVWVLEQSAGVLRRVSPGALTTVQEIPVGAGSSALVADSAAIWVANGESGRLLRIDPRSNRVVARIPVRASDNVTLAAGGGAVWWIDKDRGAVTRIDPNGNRVVGSPLLLGGPAGGGAVSGRTLWVTRPSAPSVARIRF